MAQIKLNSEEIVNFLNHIITNNRHIQAEGKIPVAIEVTGDAGLGKTSVVSDFAHKQGLKFVKVNLAMIEELGDLVGFPVRQFQLCKESGNVTPISTPNVEPQYEFKMVPKNIGGKIVNVKEKVLVNPDITTQPASTNLTDECVWVDENAVEQYTKRGYNFTGQKRMSYCPPEWIADAQQGGILLLDDYTRADARFLQACMELIDRQEYISWKLPKDWHIILSTNPDDGNYTVNSIDTAQKTRFISVQMKWDENAWAKWAESKGIDGRCINFVLMNPEIVTATVNPRAITTFFNCISSFSSFEDNLPMLQMIGEGSVGSEVATLFTTFINNRLDKLVTPKEIFLGADFNVVTQKLLDAICDGGNMSKYRADIASILTTRLINYVLVYAENNPIAQNHIDRLINLVKHPDIFTDDLKYHLVKKVLNGNKQKFQKLLFDQYVQDCAVK